MKKGFSHGVAPDLVRQKPGMTANEVAELALSRGLCSSDAKDPVDSLGKTLAKEVREGRLPEVYANRVGGLLRYYPAEVWDMERGETWVLPPDAFTPDGQAPRVAAVTSAPTALSETVSIRLPRDKVELADLLVEAGQFSTRSEALAYLVGEGIARNHPRIEKVRQAVEQIRAIKRSLEST